MHALSKEEFKQMITKDLEDKKRRKENDYKGYVTDSVMRCNKASRRRHKKMAGQR